METMDTLQHARPAAGWYQDPYEPTRLRWWSGVAWTNYTAAFPPPAPLRRRSRFSGGEVVALVFGLVIALLLAVAYWSGGSLAIPGATSEPEALGEVAPPSGGGADQAPDDPAPGSAPAADLSDAYAASVMVESNCGAGCVGVGGGVAVGPDTVLTAEHVVSDSRVVGVLDAEGNAMAGTVIATDARRDLALLRVEQHGLPYVSVRDAVAVVGEEAHVVGSPNGQRRISEGTVTGVLDLERDGVIEIQTNADIDQGNSGGPLLDADGRLLGIVVAEHERDDTIGWATSAADVQQFLAAATSGTAGVPDPLAGVDGPYRELLDDLLSGFLP
jgi:putative serine protease PepD